MSQSPKQRPFLASLFMSLPVIFGGMLIVAIAILLLLSQIGGTASGERLQIRLVSSCAETAAPLISARMESIGLGEPELAIEGEEITIVATMPGNDDDRTDIPQLLSQTGAFTATHQDVEVLSSADLEDAGLDFDDSGMPMTALTLEADVTQTLTERLKADSTGEMLLMLDGKLLARRPNAKYIEDQTVQIISGEGLTEVRMKRAIDRAILIKHGPLPCPVSVVGVANAEAPR